MRILIGNHIDASILIQADQRAFVQRIFWFAQDHDIIILPAPLDEGFLVHVTNLTKVDPRTLKIHVTSSGRFEHRLFDPETLLDEALLSAVAADARDVSEIFALWPSAQVAEFSDRLGLSQTFPGGAFFSQQGDELANSKGNFRAFAAASGVPIAEGAVCRTREHAGSTLRRLLGKGTVMMKQAHNHAGNGNQIVAVGEDICHRAGSIGIRKLSSLTDVQSYLDEQWDWASAHGRFPVVIEQFRPNSRTIYAEFLASDAGVELSATGSLGYSNGKLVEESYPLRDVSADVHARLVHHGSELAQLYQRIGYRGCLSADAVVDETGNLFFTEMNARVGGSLHVYKVIGKQIVDVWKAPERTVVQYVTGNRWKIPSLAAFLDACSDMGLAYDRGARKGIIVAMPMAGTANRGGFLFCVSYEDEIEAKDAYKLLEERFA